MDNFGPPTPLVTSLLGFAVAFIFLVVFYVFRSREERGWLMRLAILAFLLKAILVPIYFEWLISEGMGGFAKVDAYGYHHQAIEMNDDIEYDLPHITWGWHATDPGFYRVTAFVYRIFGPNTLVIRFFLIMSISMSLLYVYRITRLYFDEKTARLAAGLQAFLPAPILLQLNHRKDPLVQLIVLFLLYHAVRVFRQDPGWMRSLQFILIGLFAVFPFRSGLILPFIGIMVLCFVIANRNFFQGFSLSFITVIALIVLQLSAADDSAINLDTFTRRAEGKLAQSAALSESTSGMVRLLRVTGPLDLYKVPFAAIAYLILPFPPNFWTNPVEVLSSTLHLFAIFLFPHMLIGAWSMIRGPDWRRKLPLLVFPIGFLLVLGAVHIGVIRYRQIFYPICIIWMAVGWRIGASFFFKLATYGTLGILAIIVYLNRFGFL